MLWKSAQGKRSPGFVYINYGRQPIQIREDKLQIVSAPNQNWNRGEHIFLGFSSACSMILNLYIHLLEVSTSDFTQTFTPANVNIVKTTWTTQMGKEEPCIIPNKVTDKVHDPQKSWSQNGQLLLQGPSKRAHLVDSPVPLLMRKDLDLKRSTFLLEWSRTTAPAIWRAGTWRMGAFPRGSTRDGGALTLPATPLWTTFSGYWWRAPAASIWLGPQCIPWFLLQLLVIVLTLLPVLSFSCAGKREVNI